MRSPPARRTRSPCYRSAGHRLFSLHMALSRERGWSNGTEIANFHYLDKREIRNITDCFVCVCVCVWLDAIAQSV